MELAKKVSEWNQGQKMIQENAKQGTREYTRDWFIVLDRRWGVRWGVLIKMLGTVIID